MHNEVKSAFTTSLTEALEKLAANPPVAQEPFLTWRRSGSAWRGRFPNFGLSSNRIFTLQLTGWHHAEQFSPLFEAHYSRCLGMVGTSVNGQGRCDSTSYLKAAVRGLLAAMRKVSARSCLQSPPRSLA